MRTKHKQLMVNCKACGRPFPMPDGQTGEGMHQCPYCAEESMYSAEDMTAGS